MSTNLKWSKIYCLINITFQKNLKNYFASFPFSALIDDVLLQFRSKGPAAEAVTGGDEGAALPIPAAAATMAAAVVSWSVTAAARHILWCDSQSLCWQKAPQYFATLQPEQVSEPSRPQFQQISLVSDWLLLVDILSNPAASLSVLLLLLPVPTPRRSSSSSWRARDISFSAFCFTSFTARTADIWTWKI